MALDTLPKLLKQNHEKYGDKKIALREKGGRKIQVSDTALPGKNTMKNLGIWHSYTWKDYYEKAKYFFYGLVSLGFARGHKLAILGDAKPEAFWAELGAQARGGIVFGIFADCRPEEVKYFVEHSECEFVLAQDQEQVDKLLDIKNELPRVKKVIYWDPKGLWFYDDPILLSFDEVLHLGREYEREHPGLFEPEIEIGKGEDIAVLLYTSGTTALPKAAMVSHAAIIAYGQTLADRVDKARGPEGEWIALLPLAWVAGQGFDLTTTLLLGMTVNFPEKPETVMENIREVGPAMLFFAPSQWESLSRTIQAKMIDAHSLKRFFYHLFLPVGYKITDMRLNKQRIDFFWRALHFLAHLMMFRPLLDKLGFLRLKLAGTGGTAVSPDMLRLMHAIGINLLQGYGSSDFGGFVALHEIDDVKWETTGPPCPGVEVLVTEEGELLVKQDIKWLYGYYKNPELYRQSIKAGWFHTGDSGYIRDDGHLVIMDRMKDLRELKGGRRFSPQYTEIRLRFSPFIKNALAIGGEDKDYVAVLVNIDIENVGRWAETRRIAYTTFADLSQKSEVIELIGSEVRKVNENLPESARIRKFINLHKELDPDEAEITRTRKIRRTFLEERYRNIADALYSRKTELEVQVPVTYQDGRTGTVKGSVRVNTVH